MIRKTLIIFFLFLFSKNISAYNFEYKNNEVFIKLEFDETGKISGLF